MAGMDVQVYKYIMEINPEVLLSSDVTTYSEHDKTKLIEVLLQLFDEGKLYDDWDMHRNYAKLNHPGLSSQLRPYIT